MKKRTERRSDRSSPSVPAWIDRDLIERTIRVWGRYYTPALTTDDAVAILVRVGRLVDDEERSDEQAVPGVGTRVEP